jgi:hypothetical protein
LRKSFKIKKKNVYWYFQKTESLVPGAGVWRPSNFYSGSSLKSWIILNLAERFIRENELRWV